MTNMRQLTLLLVFAGLVACGDNPSAETEPTADAGSDVDAAPEVPDAETPSPNPFDEVIEQGAARYIGDATWITEFEEGPEATFVFGIESGPICLYGDPYKISVRDAEESEDLLIFLQGGGACWSDLCLALDTTLPRVPVALDVLDPELEANPVRDWNVAYWNYCDGSLFAGDVDVDEDGDGTVDRYQRGLRNLTAALDATALRYPDPERVLLAGSSGGGFGTILTTLLVRVYYPDAELLVFNDAGVGVTKGDAELDFVDGLVEEWGAHELVPASCGDCFDNGHLTPIIAWQLEQDPNLRIAAFSGLRDFVIADLFLQVGGRAFEPMLLEQTADLAARFPGRYAAFLAPGGVHTVLVGDVAGVLGEEFSDSSISDSILLGEMGTLEVDGVIVSDWFQDFVDGSPDWGPVVPPPEE